MVAVGVLLDDPDVGHQRAQAVIQVLAALTDVIDALHHLVGLVVGVGPGDALLIVLGVEFLDQIAPLIIGVSSGGLQAVITAAGDRVEMIELVVRGNIIGVGLPGEVAQNVIVISTAGVPLVFLSIGHAVQRIIGIEILFLLYSVFVFAA